MDHRSIILDYSEFIEDRREGYDSELFDDYNSYSEPAHPELFFAIRGWCPFCHSAAANQPKKSIGIPNDDPWISDWMETNVWVCQNCGWWEIEHNEGSYAKLQGTWRYSVLRHGVLRSFDVASATVPVDVLKNYLAAKPDLIRHIHPRKMEQLTQSVFADFYDCEVEHCGGPNDKGIDLIVVQSDVPVVIQVKRRAKPGSAESVSVVRHFIGAMLVEGYRRGAIVTTAHHFSNEAQEVVQRALTRDLVDRIDLVDAPRFVDRMNLFNSQTVDSWRRYLPAYSAFGCSDDINADKGFNTIGATTNLLKLLR